MVTVVVGLVVEVEGGCEDGIIRGVNLGGWLLLEPWITPSLFEEVNRTNQTTVLPSNYNQLTPFALITSFCLLGGTGQR